MKGRPRASKDRGERAQRKDASKHLQLEYGLKRARERPQLDAVQTMRPNTWEIAAHLQPLGSHGTCRRLSAPPAILKPSTIQHGRLHRSSIEPTLGGTAMQVPTVAAALLVGLIVV
jgi:hypothetical protein